ncbi:MAG: adenine-specific DNA-methyltransferase, partial [Oleiphilaceae bacterium]
MCWFEVNLNFLYVAFQQRNAHYIKAKMTTLSSVELIRHSANLQINPKTKGALGQFFTPAPISLYMASLFDYIDGHIELLDPGCGPCSLTAAFLDECIKNGTTSSIHVDAYDIDEILKVHALKSIDTCRLAAEKNNIKFKGDFHLNDFVENINKEDKYYSHIIMNPPYKKILNKSSHRKSLREAGIETVNLYSGFVALAIQKLQLNGELVAIIPRSFCNGPYYQPFRELILKETAIKHIHIFESRKKAFSGDDVLQENVIIHLVKGAIQQEVTITSSPAADFHIDKDSGSVTATDKTTRTVSFESIVNPKDTNQFIHIAANNRDQDIIDKLSVFTSTLENLNIQVSTGPVVGFRLNEYLRENMEEGAVPLIYPIHLSDRVGWPKESKKPNAIKIADKTRPWLWKHQGSFVIVKRLSSKEEKRRIVATPYDSSLPGELIGFENKLNVFHSNKVGFDNELALGLSAYLNCTLLDKYYRLFGGHTQVNATDLRSFHYPNLEILRDLGSQVKDRNISQDKIDDLINKEIIKMTGENNNPLAAQKKIDQAIEIIEALGLPKAQQNERSALTLLSLLNLHPSISWSESKAKQLGVTPIMDWVADVYGKQYAPNSRETFRRQTLHQFVDSGICLYNPDKHDRPVNSPKACYKIAPELQKVLKTYNTAAWDKTLAAWLINKKTLVAQYAMKREMELIPLRLDDDTEIKLSPGIHSQLIHDIVTEFGPRFAPGSEVIYLGDTGAKEEFFRKERLAKL